MKLNKIIALLFALTIVAPVFCEDDNQNEKIFDQTENYSYTKKDFRHISIAFTEVLLNNLIVNAYGRMVMKADYAKIDIDTMWDNITHAWVWDQDRFLMNQLGHPLQGSFYHVAARANGMNYYEGLGLSLTGSFLWEELMENSRPSLNDVVTTPIAGSILGEIFHRLYCEVLNKNQFLAFFVSPQDGFNFFITGERPVAPNDHISDISLYFGGGVSGGKISNSELLSSKNNIVPSFGGGMRLIYGEPYRKSFTEPFSQFNVTFFGHGMPGDFEAELFTDGMLFAGTTSSKQTYTSFGMNLIYEFIYANDINYAKTGLGFSLKQENLISDETSLRWNANVNANLMGGSENYYLNSQEKFYSENGLEQRLYNLGLGGGAYINAEFENKKAGLLRLAANVNGLWYIPPAIQDEGSEGGALVFFCQADYEHKVYKNWWLGASVFYYHKNDFYKELEDIQQDYFRAGLYILKKFGD